MVNATPRPLYPRDKNPVPIVQEAGWAPGPVWTGAGNLVITGIRSPDRQARSESLYRLSYRGQWWDSTVKILCEVPFSSRDLILLLFNHLSRIRRTRQIVKLVCNFSTSSVHFFLYRSVRIVVKSVCYIRHVRPSVRMYQRGSNWTEIWYCGLLWKLCWEGPNLVKIGQTTGTLREDLSTFYCCQRNYIAIKVLSSSEMISGC